jgi:hypothetical protein
VGVGVLKAGGEVCVGKMAALPVTVGLKTAVMVRSGVGNTIGVGDEIKGKLQASEVITSTPIINRRFCFCLFILPSLTDNSINFLNEIVNLFYQQLKLLNKRIHRLFGSNEF